MAGAAKAERLYLAHIRLFAIHRYSGDINAKNKQISLSTGTEKFFNLDFAAISHKLYASKVMGCLGANSCRAIFLSSSISASCTALSKSSSDCSSSS